MLILNITLFLIFGYFSVYVSYYLIFAFSSRFKKSQTDTAPGRLGTFAVLIPAYKEDQIIVNTALKNLSQNYPSEKFDIVIIADSLQQKTLDQLYQLPVHTIKVELEKSSKGKAINVALAKLEKKYDYVLILDADNVMAENCLQLMNEELSKGTKAIQGHRTAKNRNNSLAILDSISEEVNNNIFRKGQRVLGLSSSLIGSGMAFHFEYYKGIINGVEDIWEDRELEFRILKQGDTIEYLDKALVFDEKVTDHHVFRNQRSKWIAGQIYYFKKYIFANWKLIFRGNIDLLNKLIQTMSPPRSLLLGCLTFFLILSFFVHVGPNLFYWLILYLVLIISLFLAIPRSMVNNALFRASLRLPFTIVMMFLGMLKSILGRNVNFNTPHVEK